MTGFTGFLGGIYGFYGINHFSAPNHDFSKYPYPRQSHDAYERYGDELMTNPLLCMC